MTAQGEFKRLYPVRFRHLKGENSFKRWDKVTFKYILPKHDTRAESCRVFEDSIVVDGVLKKQERSRFLNPLVVPSVNAAIALGRSLAMIRPLGTRFFYKQKSSTQLQEERDSYKLAAAQGSLFDAELAALEPSPYEFKFKFRDEETSHEYANGDWEAHAMFYNERGRGKSDTEVLRWMDHIFNDEYPKRGILFAIGNQAKRPQTWQLLGVLRVDETAQSALKL